MTDAERLARALHAAYEGSVEVGRWVDEGHRLIDSLHELISALDDLATQTTPTTGRMCRCGQPAEFYWHDSGLFTVAEPF